MVTPRVTRALNPQRKKKFTLKQIRAGFGGKRRKASLKAPKRHAHKRRATASNPKKRRKRATAKAKNATRVVYRTKYKTRTKKVYVAAPKKRRKANPKRRRSKSRNPGPYLLTMAPVGNPHKKRRKSVAKTRRKVSAKGRSGKRRNPTRRRRSVARRSNHRRRSMNPLGASSTTLKTGVGVFLGFSAAKKVPPMLGPSMNSSPMMTLLSTAITAGLAAWLAKRFVPGAVAEGVLWGGVGGVINVAWNAWAPASISGYAGVGDFVAGGFPLPQGPVRYPIALGPASAPNGSPVDIGAFGTAFTRAW